MIPHAWQGMWAAAVPPALSNHLWQSTLFAGGAGLLTLALRKNQARARYWLWLAASVKFLIPFSLLIGLGSHLARPSHVASVQPELFVAMDAVSQPFALPEAIAEGGNRERLQEMLAAAWLCGFVVVLAVWAVRWRRVAAAVREATPLREGREVEMLRRMERLAGIRRRIEFMVSRESLEPGIFGMVRPVLLWPERISERLDEAHLEAVLAHEVWHVRRWDNMTAALHMAVEAVFWFHPLVWWLDTRLVEERERACDEQVLLLCQRPRVYAESILKVCEFCVELPLTCVSGVTGADLKKRVGHIMSKHIAQKLNFSRKLLLVVAGLMAIAVPMAFGVVRMIPLYGQIEHASGPLPSFEVATIKPFKGGLPAPPLPGTGGPPPRPAPTGGADFSLTSPTRFLIASAYNVPIPFSKAQIVGGPDWIDTDMYEVHGKIEESMKAAMDKMPPEQRRQQTQLMEQSLLADRLKLKVHFETRELPVYALVVAKGGAKLTSVKALPASTVNPPLSSPQWRIEDFKKGMLFLPKGQGTEMTARAVTLDEFAHEGFLTMNPAVGGRMVVNQTGLMGTYDFTLRVGREQPATAAGEATPLQDDAPPLFTALQQQLGLRLMPTKGPVEVIVIDHIERPSPN